MNSIPIQTIDFAVQIIVEPDEGGFYAYCPALKGLHVGGDTEEEALQNARDATIAYLHSLIRHGEPIPIGITATTEFSGASSRSKGSVHEHMERVHIDNVTLIPA